MNERKIRMKDGGEMPALGQGTWHMGDHKDREEQEIESIRLGVSLGMTLLDTAEMYGEGASERMLGKAIAPLKRDELFLVSKAVSYTHLAFPKLAVRKAEMLFFFMYGFYSKSLVDAPQLC